MSLFSASLIPSLELPSGYTIRPLTRTDYSKGFLDVLRGLTSVGEIAQSAWEERYDEMAKRDGYYIVVIEDEGGRIVGVGTLLVEVKL